MLTNDEKLLGVRTELVILLPRLTPQYRKGVEACIQWLKEVEADITPADDGRPGQFEDATIKALPLYKRLIELAGEAEDRIDAPNTPKITNIRLRGQYTAFMKAAEMVKEIAE